MKKEPQKGERPSFRIVNIMKIATFLFFLNFMVVYADNSYSQNTVFSFTLKDASISKVFNHIEKESEYVFIYTKEIAPTLKKKTSIDVHSANINIILDNVLKETNLTYRIKDRQITVFKKNETRQTPNLRIEGFVRDSYGEPLIGVTVQEAGTNNIAVTDTDGKYTLYNITSSKSKIRFSYVGFKMEEVVIGDRTQIDITLLEDAQGLEEVVVVGYGQQKKESVIGAITTVKPAILQTNQTRSLTNGLAGQVAGIIAVQRSGEPGYDNSDFWIRGVNTFGANANPLVLVDGVERSLNNISPEEIESFSVLKDATATAVYGVRGANGVILIQTKKGKLGKPTIVVKADFGVSTPTQLPEFVDAAKYMEVLNDAQRLSGLNPLYSDEDIRRTRIGYDPDLYPNVDWIDAVTKKYTPTGKASVDINGGSERLKYSLVLSYYNESGMIVTDKSKNYDSQLKMTKYNVRSNVDLTLTPSTDITVSIGGYITDRNAPGTGISTILSRTMDTPPNVHPTLYSNGEIPKLPARYNPWSDATQTGYQKRFESNIESLITLTQDIGKLWEPLKGLSARGLFSFDSFNYHTQKRTKTPPSYQAVGRNEEGDLITTIVDQGQEFLGYEKGAGGNRTVYIEGRLNYNRTFGDHRADGLFLFNMRDRVIQDASSAILSLPYRNTGIAGRAAYSYKDTYFTEFNFGYNGSENFKRGYRFGFFPAVAVGWLVTNEKWMEPLSSTLTKLKIRGSWGLVGNDQLSNDKRFSYLSTINRVGGYRFGYTNNINYADGYREGEFGIDNLTWETAEKLNLGIELGLWKSINMQIDIFKEHRKDIFMQRKTIPEILGYNVMPWANFGKVDNKGIEIELAVNHQFKKDFILSARGNFTYAKNKVIEYDEPEDLKKTTRARTGQSLNQHFGLIAEGLFTEDDFSDVDKGILKKDIPNHTFGKVQPGDIKYKDINGDGVVDTYDETPIGKPYVPQIVYGFGVNLQYKNIDFGAFFQGTGNFTNMLHGSTLIPGSGGGGVGNIYSNVDDRWTPENPRQDVFWPRLASIESQNNMRYSTWWIRDASYLRLKNLEVGYTLPKKWQRAVSVRNLRVFLRGSNILTFAKFDMWDPELGSQNGLKYPLQKIYTAGFEITF